MDADDLIQETLVALVGALPHYTYEPDEKGHFHNYLTGILRHKGLAALKKKKQDLKLAENLAAEGLVPGADQEGEEEQKLRHATYELALRELLANPDIQSRTKQVFIQVAVNGEKPEAVALAYGMTRNSVDQLKPRMILKLKNIVSRLKPEDVVS